MIYCKVFLFKYLVLNGNLMSSDGTIIEGKTRTIKNYQKYEGISKKLTSIGRLLGGLAVPLAKMLPYLLQSSIH